MSIPFTPMRVAAITGVVVFASVAAPKIAAIRSSLGGETLSNVASTVEGKLALVTQKTSRDTSPITAPLFRYKDKSGRTHYVSTEAAIPAEYRAIAESNLKLPKVTYSDFPTPEPLKRAPTRSQSEDETLPYKSAARKPPSAAAPEVPYIAPPSTQRSQRDGESDPTSSSSSDKLGLIKYWLNFVKDTFMKASEHLS